jgi:hypothetical protein
MLKRRVRTVFCGLVLLCLVISALADRRHNVDALQETSGSQVPKGFSYPEAFEIIQVEKSIPVKSLSGKVVNPAGSEIQEALVERMSTSWKERLDATFTDANGKFSFSNMPQGIYYLKVSYPNFDTFLIKVMVKKRAKSKLSIQLHPSA